MPVPCQFEVMKGCFNYGRHNSLNSSHHRSVAWWWSQFAKASFSKSRPNCDYCTQSQSLQSKSHGKIFIIHVFAILPCFFAVVWLFHLCLTCDIFLQLCEMGDTLAKLLKKKKNKKKKHYILFCRQVMVIFIPTLAIFILYYLYKFDNYNNSFNKTKGISRT